MERSVYDIINTAIFQRLTQRLTLASPEKRIGPGRRTNARTDFSVADLAWRNRGLALDSRESRRRARQAARIAAAGHAP
jgi:hypothetical protein